MTAWQADVTTLQTAATAITSINTDLSNLATAVSGLTGVNGALTAVTASSSETAILNATALTGAATADYTVVVAGLATVKRYLLAHDLGTSGNKATLFTTDGKLVRSVTIPVRHSLLQYELVRAGPRGLVEGGLRVHPVPGRGHRPA